MDIRPELIADMKAKLKSQSQSARQSALGWIEKHQVALFWDLVEALDTIKGHVEAIDGLSKVLAGEREELEDLGMEKTNAKAKEMLDEVRGSGPVIPEVADATDAKPSTMTVRSGRSSKSRR